jgi:hypothetical protein
MSEKNTKDGKKLEARNAKFGNEKMGQGMNAESLKGKNPTEALPTEGAHDTAPEKDNLELREDKGS